MRKAILLGTAALVLLLINYTIWHREKLITDGRSVLLELAPVDPRSLMQGDYMALRFKVANEAFPRGSSEVTKDGRVVLAVDSRNVGSFRRFDDGQLASDEVLLRYRVRNRQPKLATNAFFFQEGHAKFYQEAKYGEFRLAPDGEALLVALRGAELQSLGPPLSAGN